MPENNVFRWPLTDSFSFIFILFMQNSKYKLQTSAGFKLGTNISVTRWRNYFSDFWLFFTMKIWPMALKFPKVGSKVGQILKKHRKITKDFIKICQSGEISPSLVTLLESHFQGPGKEHYLWMGRRDPLVHSPPVEVPFEDHAVLLRVVDAVVAVQDHERDTSVLDHGWDKDVVQDH